MAEGHTSETISKRRLILIAAGSFVAAVAIAACFILPAEFRLDPTGFGRATGLDRLAGTKEVSVDAASLGATSSARLTAAPFRSETIEIPLTSGLQYEGSELEYKVRMKKGDMIVFAWEVIGTTPAEEFYSDFHSQSDPNPDIKVVSYHADLGNRQSGGLVAPFDGIHGWYLQNQGIDPVKVRLRLSGHYTLVTPEELAAASAAAAQSPQPTGPPGP